MPGFDLKDILEDVRALALLEFPKHVAMCVSDYQANENPREHKLKQKRT